MIGNLPIDKDGKPVDATKLTPSSYQASDEVRKIYGYCQNDYQRAYSLQHRSFDEFDGLSLLQRAKKDQETFGAFVGAKYVEAHKKWRWQGRKNTARNKLISILAHMISGMLYPLVSARNEEDEPDKLSARVMRIIVEDELKKANYEMKFLYMLLSALVNPAAIVQVEYTIAYQRIKEELADGKIKVTEAIDQFLSGLALNIQPIDQLLLGDFYVNEIQEQPFIIKIRRLSYDTARAIYAGKHFVDDGAGGKKDCFDYVEAGKTRFFLTGNEKQTLYDIEWTEGDINAVQEATFYYRPDDVELTFVGGVFMGNEVDPWNSNRFSHRRMSLISEEWKSIPIYPFAKTYFEPIDPSGRFAYGKSGAFKEYWDDASINRSYQLLQDGMTLEVIKPLFISGVTKVDSIVIAPGATAGIPANATVNPWSMGPNLAAAMNVLRKNEEDLGLSTQNEVVQGQPKPGVSATQTNAAIAANQRQLSVFGLMVADLIRQVGELTMDCVVQHTTAGELDATVPEALQMKYKMILAKTKERGKDVTHRISFKSNLIGRKVSKQQKEDYEWKLWKDKGGDDQIIYHINPYKFARTQYGMTVDAEEITNHALGTDREQKKEKYNMLSLPFVYPFVDQKALADDVIEEYSDGDPDHLKAKQQAGGSVDEMMKSVMGGGSPDGGNPGAKQSPMMKANLPALTA